MKHAVTRELFGYWTRLRGSRAAPERKDVDPAAIRAILCDTFVLEVDHGRIDPSYPIRLSGTRLNALFLDELKGRSLRSLWSAEAQPALHDMLGAVADDCAPVVAGLRAGPDGHRPIDLEMILLPLRHHGRTHARMLGAIAPVEVPSWLGLLPIRPFAVASHRLIRADTALPGALPDPLLASLAQPPRRYGPFVLHQGGRTLCLA